mgnify:CR=1 FL=1
MNKLSLEKRTQIITCLVEGNSIRSTCRMTGAAKGTVTRLLESVGTACGEYQDKHLVDLTCNNLQCDEIWSFCYAKEKNVPEEYKGVPGYGDVWTWVAIDADTKLVPSWYVGDRSAESAYEFLSDIQKRMSDRIQLTSDGYPAYIEQVKTVFGNEIDYAMLTKIYGGNMEDERRYSPAEYVTLRKDPVIGMPEMDKVSTSYVERQNLTMRMSMRRFTRLTNAFSKKIENLEAAVALHFMYYNFSRPHKALNKERSLGITPAMAAGVADHQWSVEEIAEMTT